MAVCKGEGDKGYEIFQHGKWDVSTNFEGLVLFMKRELYDLFGRHGIDAEGKDVRRPPPEPMQNDSFITKVSECMVKYLPRAESAPLDFNMWYKLLFADGQVYDFQKDELRPQHAEDRLRNHTARGVPVWDAPVELKEHVRQFATTLREFFVTGGRDLDPITDSSDERHFVESGTTKAARIKRSICPCMF